MKKELILILVTILLMASAYCLAEEPDLTLENVKTGDIEVFAVGCNPPPYENGMLLMLNRMPNSADTLRLKAFVEFLEKNSDANQWLKIIEDSFPSINEDAKLYLIDVAMHQARFLGEYYLIPFTMFNVARAISDSSGYYKFENIPPGLYQIVCNTAPAAVKKTNAKEKIEKDTVLKKDERGPRHGCEKSSPIDPPGSDPYGRIDNRSWHDYCLPGAVNLIRVAPDSVSVVNAFEYAAYGVEVVSNYPLKWEGKMYKRKDGKK